MPKPKTPPTNNPKQDNQPAGVSQTNRTRLPTKNPSNRHPKNPTTNKIRLHGSFLSPRCIHPPPPPPPPPPTPPHHGLFPCFFPSSLPCGFFSFPSFLPVPPVPPPSLPPPFFSLGAPPPPPPPPGGGRGFGLGWCAPPSLWSRFPPPPPPLAFPPLSSPPPPRPFWPPLLSLPPPPPVPVPRLSIIFMRSFCLSPPPRLPPPLSPPLPSLACALWVVARWWWPPVGCPFFRFAGYLP